MRVAELEAVDVMKREDDDALADLRRAEQCPEERDECRRGRELQLQARRFRYWG